MNAPFKINRVIADINHQKIDEKFDFFEIAETRKDKYFEFNASLLDDLVTDKSIRAVQFHGGKKVYVMMNKDENNLDRIKTAKDKSKDADYLSCNQVSSEDVERDHRLVQLFFNGLFRSEHPKLSYNNVGGHLYCFHPKWIKRTKNVIWKIPTLDVKVNWQNTLSLPVCTFSDLKLTVKKAESNEAKAKIFDKPQYVYLGNNTMRRKNDSDTSQVFVIGSPGNSKVNIPFIKLWPATSFPESKMGMLANIVEKFNQDYCSLIHVDFVSIEDYKSYNFSKDVEKENKAAIERALSNVSIKILDEIDDEKYDSKNECKRIQKAIKDKYHLESSIGKRPDKKGINISLIHEPEYYESTGETDPHNKKIDRISIQHITLQNGMQNLEESISTIIQNALIKKDLQNQQITLFDWTKTNLAETITFGYADKIAGTKFHRYYFMDVNPDGTFKITELEHDAFNHEEYQKCIDIFERAQGDKRSKEAPAEGIIRDSIGSISVIRGSDKFTLPDFAKIKEKVDNGETNIKRAATFEEYYSGCMNIKMFEDCGKTYYCVGRKDKNPSLAIPRAVNVREVQVYEGEPILFEKLLSLMSVEFVRNGQLTVVPFPFKYLREWVEMNREK